LLRIRFTAEDIVHQLLSKFRVALVITAAIALATSALAQATEVIGTGNPDVDVPAVQAAVNLGGEVVLMGHFSFDTPPTILTAFQADRVPASYNSDLETSRDLRCGGRDH
jgi:hypothetical protein